MPPSLFARFKESFIAHVILAYIFLLSGVIVNCLELLVLPLWYLGYRDLYRKLISRLSYLSWGLIPGIAQWWAGIECYIYGTPEELELYGRENVIAVLNHRGQLDWVISWVISDYCNILSNAKCMVKSVIAFVPVLGWGYWFSEYIFLKRKLEKDKKTVDEGLKNLTTFSEKFWMLIFCEGTRFTYEKHKLSQEYAIKNDLKPLEHHLTPRTKGFHLISQGLRGTVSSVYDATVCFRNEEPIFTSMLEGKPCVADFMVRRIPISDVPSNEKESAEFVYKIYQEKDEIYEYHKQNNEFPFGDKHPKYKRHVQRKVTKNIKTLFLILFWSVVTLVPLLYYIFITLTSGSIMQISILVAMTLIVIGVFFAMLEMVKQPKAKYEKSK